MVQLGDHFAGKDRGAHVDALRQQRWFIKAREDHQRREKTQDRLDDDFAALAVETVMATQAQVQAFEAKLDSYDEATVRALMENQELMDAVNARIDAMLDQAHTLEDGRRVFRTEDGAQVFDEHGASISELEIDPMAIDPTLPSWEDYSDARETQQALATQREELLEFQEKLDDAREQAVESEISEVELEALDAELMDMMPDAVVNLNQGEELANQAQVAVEPLHQKPATTLDGLKTQIAPMVPGAFQ